MFLRLAVSASEKLRTLTDPAVRDRGEGPVPHVVMIFVMAAGAIVIGGLVIGVAKGWVNRMPTTAPAP